MSIPTMNWALGQRLESDAQQILLYVIADSTDPTGVTRHCDPEYMAAHARMTRATMFRRLGELETLGLLRRSKFYNERGAPIYQIELDLAKVINLPLKRRRKREDEVDDDDHDGEATADEAAAPESHGETLAKSQGETLLETKVSGEASPQSHSCDCISPPDPKNLPLPPPGGSLSKREGEQSEKRATLWDRFRQSYPGIGPMDQQAARDELDALSLDDAEWAVSVIPQLKEDLRRDNNRSPKNAHIWVRKEMFRNYPRAKIEAPPPDEVWIAEGSDEDLALRFIRKLAKEPLPFVLTRADGVRGYPHKTAVGPDLLAMLAFVNDVPLRWIGYPRGTPRFEAWQARFHAWIGRRLPTETGTDCIRAPCPWPPKKDGTIYDDNEEGNDHA